MAVINEIMKPLYLFIVQRPQAAGLPNGSTECLSCPAPFAPAVSLDKEYP